MTASSLVRIGAGPTISLPLPSKGLAGRPFGSLSGHRHAVSYSRVHSALCERSQNRHVIIREGAVPARDRLGSLADGVDGVGVEGFKFAVGDKSRALHAFRCGFELPHGRRASPRFRPGNAAVVDVDTRPFHAFADQYCHYVSIVTHFLPYHIHLGNNWYILPPGNSGPCHRHDRCGLGEWCSHNVCTSSPSCSLHSFDHPKLSPSGDEAPQEFRLSAWRRQRVPVSGTGTYERSVSGRGFA